MKKLIPAIVMLIVSAVVLSTASYAWFTTSDAVSAKGMQVTAEAPSSVLIRGTSGKDASNAYVWSEFSSLLNFADGLGAENLHPVSSLDGVAFFTPSDCSDASGAAEFGASVESQTNGADYWVDYQIELKNDASATEGEAINLVVESIKLQDGTACALANAVRVAVIVGTPGATSNSTDSVEAADDASNVFVYTLTTNTNDYATEGWVLLAEQDTNNENNIVYNEMVDGPLTATSGLVGVAADYSDADTVIVTGLAGQQCVRITVRVWFEGQDASCVSANAGASAAIDIKFAIVD